MTDKKIHKYMDHGDMDTLLRAGMSISDYLHSTACGYVRDNVTHRDSEVTCKLCLREMTPNK